MLVGGQKYKKQPKKVRNLSLLQSPAEMCEDR
jgi:hypothetical protein